MPELPEVHTTVEGLKGVIVGKTIKEVWSDFHIGTAHGNRQTIKNKKYLERFKKIVRGAKIKSLERIGKNILIHLKPRSDLKKGPKGPTLAYTIVVHMKMTGCLMYKKDKNEKYVHLIFNLSDGNYLLLSDLRKFASVTISKTDELHLHESLAKLGPNPLDSKFSSQKLFEIIHHKKSVPIKSALLDQTAIAGIGNIYSDEILWQVGVHPLSAASKIPSKKMDEIFKAMQKILRFSIGHGGDSKSDYRNAFGGKGSFQNFHKAYGRKGEKCPKPNCRGIIQRMVIRGRSAYFCPRHQIKYV